MIQDLLQIGLDGNQNGKIVLYLLLSLVIGYLIGRYRVFRTSTFQNSGEALLSSVLLMNFRSPDYHLMNHITLPLKEDTTQVDHILISRFGVFIIETKDYKGWIFANAKHAHWTQVLFHRKFRFRNPIHQNYGHLRAVQDILDFVPSEAIKSVVVFSGEAEFKTPVPRGVYTISEFTEYLRGEKTEVMSVNRMQLCVGRLETVRLAITDQTDLEHVQSLRRRYRFDLE